MQAYEYSKDPQIEGFKEIQIQKYEYELNDIPDYEYNDQLQLSSIKHKGYDYYMNLWTRVGKQCRWTDCLLMSKEQLEQNVLQNKKSYSYEVLNNNQIIGIAEWLQDEKDPKMVEITFFGLVPEQTNKGFGSIMMKNVLNQIKKQGYNKVWLCTHSTDTPQAKKFYQKFFKFRCETTIMYKKVIYKDQEQIIKKD